MIIGGAYQGKLAYAKEMFPDVRWTDGEQCEKEAIFQYRGIFHFHKYIERLLSEGEDISELAKQLKEKNPDLILVTDEIGYGIVPMDPFLREVRENYRAHLYRAGERCKECDKSCLWNSDGN